MDVYIVFEGDHPGTLGSIEGCYYEISLMLKETRVNHKTLVWYDNNKFVDDQYLEDYFSQYENNSIWLSGDSGQLIAVLKEEVRV